MIMTIVSNCQIYICSQISKHSICFGNNCLCIFFSTPVTCLLFYNRIEFGMFSKIDHWKSCLSWESYTFAPMIWTFIIEIVAMFFPTWWHTRMLWNKSIIPSWHGKHSFPTYSSWKAMPFENHIPLLQFLDLYPTLKWDLPNLHQYIAWPEIDDLGVRNADGCTDLM